MKDGGIAERYPRLLSTHRFLPNLKGLDAQQSIMDRPHQMAAKAKEILREPMQCQKSLSVSRCRKASHMIFLLPRGLVRHFCSIVRINMIDVCDGRHDRAMSGAIASEFVGHQPPGFSPLAFEKTVEKAFSRTLIAAALHQNINDIAVLINRTPQILPFPLNCDKDFVDVPGIAQASLLVFEFSSIVRPKLLTPLPNGLIGHRDATFGQ